MNKRDNHLLLIIKEEIEILMDLVKGYNLDSFLSDEKTRRSVVLTLINIVECVKSLSDELKQFYPDTNWQNISNLRNIAAHNYWGLRMDDIWDNVTKDVPELLEQMNEILRNEGGEE